MITNINLDSSIFYKIKEVLAGHKIDHELFLMRIDDLSVENRLHIRKFINKSAKSYIVLVSSNDTIATFSYRINAFYFLKSGIAKGQLKALKHKVGSLETIKYSPKIIFNSKNEGQKIYEISNIGLIQGKGDYCDFNFLDGTSYFDSRRIGDVLRILDNHPDMFKLNRSIVINISRISKIVNCMVFFTDSEVKVKLSPNAVSEVKKRLLWLND